MIAMCDCRHPMSEHQRYDASLGDNPVYRWLCRQCSCIDPEAVGHAGACAIHTGGECSRLGGCLQDGS